MHGMLSKPCQHWITKSLDGKEMWVRFKSNKQFAIKIYIGSIKCRTRGASR